MCHLDSRELLRYARQIRLPHLGVVGQERLKGASVLIVGAGGLGSPAALYLAAAGVGRVGIIDGDRVDVSNLHRQPLHDTNDIGRAKTDSARERLSAINPHVRIETIDQRLTSENALGIVRQYDVLIDASDNFPTRYLLNDAAVLTSRPLVHGSVDRFDGLLSVFSHEGGPCYRCLFPNPPEFGTVQNCADAGVLGVLPGLIGTLQATEALKLILGIGEPLSGRLLMVEALSMRFRTISVDRDPACRMCGTGEITALVDYDDFCSVVSRAPGSAVIETIEPSELAVLLARRPPITLIDVRERYEWNLARIPGARLIPLGELESAIPSLDGSESIVVYCHHGMRSETAASALLGAGMRRVRNLVGGIDRWSVEVDPSVPRY
jgi:molybdopterin/thiamine biosynthesis adenylyltransferase/rhodanese-related sulfurtransferase